MKKPTLLLFIFLFAVSSSVAQRSSDDAKIAAIRDAYKKVNEQIAEMEKAPEFSSIFVTELFVNKNDAPYPAVGIFQSTVRFYYTYGDREKNPYPNRLLKIAIRTQRSSRTESYEYLFSEIGELIFAFEKKDDVAVRSYFQAGRLIRFQKGDATVALNKRESKEAAIEMAAASKRLRNIFSNSL